MNDIPEVERPLRNLIASKMTMPEPAPALKTPDFLSYTDAVDSFQQYSDLDSEISQALQAIVEKITIAEAAHAEAFTCEVFGISVMEHDELVEWTRQGGIGEPPVAITKLAQPVEIDDRLGRIIQKYDMHSKPERVWVLNRLFTRLSQLHANREASNG